MDSAYGNDKNPLIEKSEFILSLFEQLVGAGNLSAKEKSILDRCTADVYREYIRSGYQSEVPTLKDLYRQLMLQPEEEARGLALSSELFINGSLNTFAQKTNVDTKNRIIAYDIRELGEQLMPLGMLVTLDSIFNRVIQNWKKGKTTWIFADEFYLLLKQPSAASYLQMIWKRARKWMGSPTGITQNISDLIATEEGQTILATSDFALIMKQAYADRMALQRIYELSEEQVEFLATAGPGEGLLYTSRSVVPFENLIPASSPVYKLLTTKAEDDKEDKHVIVNNANEYPNNSLLIYATKHFSDGTQATSTGDLDGNGTVDTNDVFEAMLYVAYCGAGMSGNLTDDQIAAADIDGDGSVDSTDVYYILYYVALQGAGKTPIFDTVKNGTALESKLAYLASDIDTESKAGENTEDGKLDATDMLYTAVYQAYNGAGNHIDWAEAIKMANGGK